MNIQVLDKASGELLASLPIDNQEAVVEAAKRGRKAQVAWAAMPVKERVRLLKLARKEFIKDKQKIIDALAHETGKAQFDVIGEMFSVCQEVAHYSGKVAKTAQRQHLPTVFQKGFDCLQALRFGGRYFTLECTLESGNG